MTSSKWVHCPVCDHRMFHDNSGEFDIEIKCTSCKRILKISRNGEQIVWKEVLKNVQKQSV